MSLNKSSHSPVKGVRASQDEWATWKQEASEAGMNLNSWIKATLNGGVPEKIDRGSFFRRVLGR